MSGEEGERPADQSTSKGVTKQTEESDGAPAEEAARRTDQIKPADRKEQRKTATAENGARKTSRFWTWAAGLVTSVRDDFAKDALKATAKLLTSYILGVLSTIGVFELTKPSPTYNDGFVARAEGGPGYAYLSSLIDHVESTSGTAVRWADGFNGLVVYCRGLVTHGIEPIDLLDAFEAQFPSCLATAPTERDDGSLIELMPAPGLEGPHMMHPMKPVPTEVWFCGCDQSVIDDVARKREALFGAN